MGNDVLEQLLDLLRALRLRETERLERAVEDELLKRAAEGMRKALYGDRPDALPAYARLIDGQLVIDLDRVETCEVHLVSRSELRVRPRTGSKGFYEREVPHGWSTFAQEFGGTPGAQRTEAARQREEAVRTIRTVILGIRE